MFPNATYGSTKDGTRSCNECARLSPTQAQIAIVAMNRDSTRKNGAHTCELELKEVDRAEDPTKN